MKLWVGTGQDPHEIEVFIGEKPSQETWVDAAVNVGGFWGPPSNSLTMVREEVMGEFPRLPAHGTMDLFEYDISGNGRLVE